MSGLKPPTAVDSAEVVISEDSADLTAADDILGLIADGDATQKLVDRLEAIAVLKGTTFDAEIDAMWERDRQRRAARAEAWRIKPRRTASRFTPIVPDLTAPRPEWIVKNVLSKKSLAVIHGKYGSGKSTVAIELCADVALGTPWHGRKVRQGTVVYVASENSHGVRTRLAALLKERGLTLDALGGRFLEITGRPHLLKPEEVQELIAELKPFHPVLCVFDTLARATAGADENAAKEMGILVENCQSIMNALGASVALVHHQGKNAALGMRGSSSLPAAADTEIIVERPDDTENFRTVKLGKQRDGADYCDLYSFELKTVEMGRDEDGDPITSVVVHEVAPKSESNMTVTELPDSPVRRAIRGVLSEAMRPMAFEEMVTAAKTKLAPPDPGEKDRRKERLKNAFERMVGNKELTVNGEMVSLALTFGLVEAPAAADDDDLVGVSS